MCDLLPDIRDVQNIKTKITFCEDNVPVAVDNTATTSSDVTTGIPCVNIKTEVKTETFSDTEASIPNDNNTNTTDNFGNDFPSNLFDFIIHESDKIDSTQKNNETQEDANYRKRKNCEGSTETCSSNPINEEECSSAPNRKICARRSSILKETQTPNTHTGNEVSYSFQNEILLTNQNDNNSKLLDQIKNYIGNSNQVTSDPSATLHSADARRNNEASPHRALANRIVSLGYQLEVFSKSNLNKDINNRNLLQETLLQCFKSLYPITLQYVLPRRNDEAYICNLLRFIAATAKHKQINIRFHFIVLILKRLIIWTAQENKKAKEQYFTDYITGDLANVLLDNTSSFLSENPNDSLGAAKNQEVKSCFFSTSFEKEKGITPYQHKEPSRGPIIESPVVNNTEKNTKSNLNQINEAAIKYNVLQSSNIPVNTAIDKSPMLRQFLGNHASLPIQLQNVIESNATYGHIMNPDFYKNSISENQPQSNQQHFQKVNNKAIIVTPNYHQPPNYQPQIYPVNKTTKCHTLHPPPYPNQIMNSSNIIQQKQQRPVHKISDIQQKNQLPPMHQNQVSNPSSNIQQVWQQHPFYNQEPLPNIRNILKNQFQQHNPIQPQFYPENKTTNTSSYYQQYQTQQQLSNNVKQQNQQLPLIQNQEVSSMQTQRKQNINLNNVQKYGSSTQNPYNFTNHQEQIRNVPPSQSTAASSAYGTMEYYDVSLFDALESSDKNNDPRQPSSPLVSAANNNATTTPVSTNPERSMSRDSGFISPPVENLETFSPTITYVTSLNKNATQMKNGACFICKRKTKTICLGCHKTYYCSTQCQYIDWKNHKLLCNVTVTKDNE